MYIKSDELTLSDQEVIDLAAGLGEAGFHSDLGFQSRVNRDAVAAELVRRGGAARRWKMGGQAIDPRYTVEGRHLPDKGLANDTIVCDLYMLERTY